MRKNQGNEEEHSMMPQKNRLVDHLRQKDNEIGGRVHSLQKYHKSPSITHAAARLRGQTVFTPGKNCIESDRHRENVMDQADWIPGCQTNKFITAVHTFSFIETMVLENKF
jgi:hypothetical protein